MVLLFHSENMTTADNQQERLRFIGWLVGFTDGEGCFSISIIKNSTTTLGYQVFPEFVITQGEKSIAALTEIQEYFKCGKLYINRRKDNHKENLYRYCVRSVEDLTNTIIPFFQKYQLHTEKKKDFELFVQAIDLIAAKQHLNSRGFKKVIAIKQKMNRKILRDYTSDSTLN